MDYDEVRAAGLGFPGVVEGTSYGTQALKLGTKLLLRRKDETTLVVRTPGMDERDLLVETEPGIFFLTDHYRGYPMILARMERLDRARFGALFEAAWRVHALKRHLKAFEG